MALQPVYISHERCGDYEEHTYALAPAEWTFEQVQNAVSSAQEDYRKSLAEVKAAGDEPVWPGYHPKYEDYPDLTVKEVEKLHKKAQKEHNDWKSKAQPQKRKFEDFLETHGLIQPWNHWDHDDILDVTVFWGHAHGSGYQYGDGDHVRDTFAPVTEYKEAKCGRSFLQRLV